MQCTSSVSQQDLLVRGLLKRIERCDPSDAARKIAHFCLGDPQPSGAFGLCTWVSMVRISAATKVVSTLPYRFLPEFKEAGFAALLQGVPHVVGDESAAQNMAKTIAVFGALGAGESSLKLHRQLACSMTKPLILDRLRPTFVKTMPGLELLMTPQFGEDFPWAQEVEEFVASSHTTFLRERNPDFIRLWPPSLTVDRRMVTSLGVKSAALIDDLLAQKVRALQPTTVEAVYDILWIECGLVKDSVLTPRSEAALSLCSVLEAILQRWNDKAQSSPDSAALLARELAPLCAHIVTLFAVFPEIRSSRFNAVIERNNVNLRALLRKGFAGGADVSDVIYHLGEVTLFCNELLGGFKNFLEHSPPNQVLLGIGSWWDLLQETYKDKEGDSGIRPYAEAFEQFLALIRDKLKTAAGAAIALVDSNTSSPDRLIEESSRRHLRRYGELYTLFCVGRAVLLGKEISEVELKRPSMPCTGADPATGKPDPKDDSEQGLIEGDTLPPLQEVPIQLSNLALVRNALHKALSSLREMSAWAAIQISYRDPEVFLPPEEPYGRILAEILDYDASSDPIEARWAYDMQILRLLACPEVQRLALYGGISRYVVVRAMREVLARQRGIDEVADSVINFES
jgi:hypothetical protein